MVERVGGCGSEAAERGRQRRERQRVVDRVRAAAGANTGSKTAALLQDVVGGEREAEFASVLVLVFLEGDARLEIGGGPVRGLQDV